MNYRKKPDHPISCDKRIECPGFASRLALSHT